MLLCWWVDRWWHKLEKADWLFLGWCGTHVIGKIAVIW